MRRNRIFTFVLYISFALLIVIAFILSLFITENKEKTSPQKEDFVVLKEGKEISAIYYDGTNVWIGGNDGVTVCNADTMEEVRYLEEFKLIYSAEITQTPDGTVWIGHEDGLTGIQDIAGEKRVDFHYPDIPKGRINTVEWDGERLWVGTYNGGAGLICEDTGWRVDRIYNRSNGLCSDSVNVICNAGESLWFASYLDTKNGGISILEKDEFQYLTSEDGIPHPYVTSLQYLGDNKMLVGTGYMDTGGLALVQKAENGYKVTETYSVEDGLPGEKVRQLFLDSEGFLWITTEYDGIVILNYERDGLKKDLNGIYLTEGNGLSDNEIKCIAETPQGYWLGGKYGLTLINRSFVREKLQ